MKSKFTLPIISSILLLLAFFLVKFFTAPELKGTYKSDLQENYEIQLTFNEDDKTFVEYINQREVDDGTFSKISDNTYNLKSNKQNFDITLAKDNSFDIFIESINKSKPINLKNSNSIVQSFSTNFADEEEYLKLIPSS